MGGGLTFLSKKSFNPSNIANQRRVWEARQQSESERRRLVEREAQIKREREEEELARVIGGEEEGGRKALGFMYEAGKVPGLKKEGNCNNNDDYDQYEKTNNNVANDVEGNLFQRQPGDDDAAAAFRAMLAQGVPNGDTDDMQERNQRCQPVVAETTADEDTADNSNNEASSRDNRTNLEKAVGRGINSGSGVTLAQQMERFPMLKAAPKVLQKQRNTGDKSEQTSANDVAGMNFKPLGQVIRNVQCMACKKWGHARGERECELSGWNPFQMSAPSAAATSSSITNMNAVDTSSTAAAPNNTEITALKSDRKHSKKRHNKGDRHDRKKKSKKQKRRRRERSPSYSDSDDSSTYSSEEERYRKKRRRDYNSDDSYDRRRSKKKERRKKSSRK